MLEKGRQVIKLLQSVAILSLIPRPREEAMQYYATVATERVWYVLYKALVTRSAKIILLKLLCTGIYIPQNIKILDSHARNFK